MKYAAYSTMLGLTLCFLGPATLLILVTVGPLIWALWPLLE